MLTIAEQRDEAKYLATAVMQDPPERIGYDHEAVELIAYAAEQKDPELLDIVDRMTAPWMESDDEKGVRLYLIEAVRGLIAQADLGTQDN